MAKQLARRIPLILFVVLLVVPTVELAIVIALAKGIGLWPTLGLLVFESLLGAYLVKREGRAAWRALQTALRTGRMPAGELADAALVLIGGTLLLTPGFLTDVVGFFFVLPFTRPLASRLLTAILARRLTATVGRVPGFTGNPTSHTVPGEVIVPDEPPTTTQPRQIGPGNR